MLRMGYSVFPSPKIWGKDTDKCNKHRFERVIFLILAQIKPIFSQFLIMKIVAIIPARLDSTRFPRKLLQRLDEKTVLEHTYLNAERSGLFAEVIIATDSMEIFEVMKAIGAKVIMTGKHETGSDRIAEASQHIEADIFVNIQGDEPFLYKQPLQELIGIFEEDKAENIDVASLKIEMKEEKEILNPNNVKVICDTKGIALYFSRLPIPFDRDKTQSIQYYKHIGVYAFRKSALDKFAHLPIGTLENAEKIEAIRFLENQMTIKIKETNFIGVGIDTPEDLEKAKTILHHYSLS